jgi:hypothetical protein
MKTIAKKVKFLSLLLGLSLLLPGVQAQTGEGFYIISGIVKNSKNKKQVEYVNVSALGTNIGTISNEDGEFTLKLSDSLQVREIEFSCIGYYNMRISVSKNEKPAQTFYLTPQSIQLNEIEVVSWKNPRDLVEAAIGKIENNYSIEPNLLTSFYRETAQKGKKYINLSEAVVQIYKNSYKEANNDEKVQILKGRKLISPKVNDTLAVKLLGGPNMAIHLDIVKTDNLVLNKDILYYYAYKTGAITSINDRLQYVVYFTPQILIDSPLYSGTFFIDRETLTFTRIEFKMDMRDKDKVTELILKRKPSGLRFSPEEINYVISYKQQDGRASLNYVHNEIKFKCDWKRRLFATNYTIISEMVVTDIRNDNVSKIQNRDAFSARQSLSDKATFFYDSDFWGAYNIIEPTESLETAIGKLKKVE